MQSLARKTVQKRQRPLKLMIAQGCSSIRNEAARSAVMRGMISRMHNSRNLSKLKEVLVSSIPSNKAAFGAYDFSFPAINVQIIALTPATPPPKMSEATKSQESRSEYVCLSEKKTKVNGQG